MYRPQDFRKAQDYLSAPSRQREFAPTIPTPTARLEAFMRSQAEVRDPEETRKVVEKAVAEFSGNTPAELRKYARDSEDQVLGEELKRLQIKMKADERAIRAARNDSHPGFHESQSRQIGDLTGRLLGLRMSQQEVDTPSFSYDNQYDGTEYRELTTTAAPVGEPQQSSRSPQYSSATQVDDGEYDQAPTASGEYADEEAPPEYSVQSVSPPTAVSAPHVPPSYSSSVTPSPPNLPDEPFNRNTYFGYQSPVARRIGQGIHMQDTQEESRRKMRLEKAKRGLRLHKYSPLLK